MTLVQTAPGRAAAAALAALALAVLAGLALLWPDDRPAAPRGAGVQAVAADVIAVTGEGCEAFAGPGCRVAEIALREGPDTGRRSYVVLPGEELAPPLEPGDAIRVSRSGPGTALDDPSAQPYAFVDFARGATLAWLALGFAMLVVALGRWQGLRSLLALGASLAVVLGFVLPALLAGRPPLAVAVVGGLAVMLVTTGITHGVGLKSVAAMLGCAAALALTAVAAVGAVEAARITGLASEESVLALVRGGGELSLTGVVVAGIVIGALGVLDDVTVSQASTVVALRRADPRMGTRRLFSEAMAVGRDHLGATVNTLVLAYVGAALPVLLIFGTQGTSVPDAINRENVAEEIVAMLVGSAGLVAAVPLATALAAVLAARVPRGALPADAHAHVH